MTTVQFPNAAKNNYQIIMDILTKNADISLAKEFQKNLSDPSHANGLIYHGKDRKHTSDRKWSDCEYHV